MEHTYQDTMRLPAAYAVLVEEEMTYLDGGAVYSFDVGKYTVSVDTDVLALYAMNLAVNTLYVLGQGSFQLFTNTIQNGLADGLTLYGSLDHFWRGLNGWSKAATVGMGVLGGYYAYAQTVSIINSLKNLFSAVGSTGSGNSGGLDLDWTIA